jgi:hypothetical protein
MNNVAYQPSGAEMALAQGWASSNGYGTVLTPWTLDTDSLSFTAPTSGGGGVVRFGFGSGVFASIAAPQGSLTGAGAATPQATVSGQAPAPAGAQAAGLSPLVIVGLAAAAYFLFLRKR